MQIREISLTEFMRFQGDTAVKLPPVGLVLITGVNGAGKSTLVEAVSYAAWGKTLRGTDPRRADMAGSARIRTGFGLELCRSWTRGMRSQLDVAHDQADESWAFDTITKAQDHVTSVLGEWDTWRRSCAFSSVDDLSFATASDSERKRLLESLIGLSRFDRAQDACRQDLKAANGDVLTHRGVLARVQTQKAEATRNLAALEQMAATQAPTANLEALRLRVDMLRDMLPVRERNLADERAAKQAAWVGQQEHRAKVTQLEREIRALEGGAACDRCGQPWPDHNDREKRLIGLRHDLAELRAEPHTGPDEARYRAAEQALDEVRTALATVQAELVQGERAAKAYREAQDLVRQAKLNILDMEDAELVAQADLSAAEYAARHLEVTDTVLGTKGARAHMLTDALTGLEAVANLWLERIARTDAPLRLKLSPYTDKKSGGTADAISLEVEGAGGGRGYRAASGGERRRIDVAIMLALGEVAQRADNRVSPTMFFDEVFDSLDMPGVEAVATALDQLAQDRCVVVMSHNTELIMNLVPDLRLHVQDGRIEHR
jgi:DNA repair exonuclease SbcCD ATPase subunit